MSTLVAKFSKVKVGANDLISSEDRSFIDSQHEIYLSVIRNLNFWKETLERANEVMPPSSDYYRMDEQYDRVEKAPYGTDENYTWGDVTRFSPLYGLAYIKSNIDYALQRRNIEIVDYFNKKYSLGICDRSHFSSGGYDYSDKEIEKVLKYVLSHTNGQSLLDASFENLKKGVADNFKNGVVEKSKIIFPNIWVDESWGKYEKDRSIKWLTIAVSMFETGNTWPTPAISEFFSNKKVGALYECDFTERFKGFRFYKNRKGELIFNNTSDALEFFDYFKLG